MTESSTAPPWKVGIQDDIIYGDPWTYSVAITTDVLRSGEDGPHLKFALELCRLSHDTMRLLEVE